MVAIPEKDSTADAIYRGVMSREGQRNGNRAHLGASLIGDECLRKLWYTFRWCKVKDFAPRIIRLFRRGQLEEQQIIEDLRAAGVSIWETNQSGAQFKVSAVNGHFGGSMDGLALGLPESPDKYHLLEFKTASEKYFKKLCKEGVEKAQPTHYAQMQTYMYLSGETDAKRVTRAMYISVNKNTDEIYTERVKYHGPTAKKLIEKAETVINSAEPPLRISNDAAFYKCKFCDFAELCHGNKLPKPNCRNCCHSTPVENGAWSCAKHGEANEVCADHVYIPQLINFAQVKEMNESDNYILYVMLDSREFKNGTRKPHSTIYTSEELQGTPVDLISDSTVDTLRVEFGAEVEPVANDKLYDDEKWDGETKLTQAAPFQDRIPF